MILGTPAYYAKRKAEIEARMVLRYYYQGVPYGTDPDDLGMIPGVLRQSVLHGDATMIDEDGNLRRVKSTKPDRADDIDYMENLARERIDAIVSAVIPSGTAIRLEVETEEGSKQEDIPKKVRQELFKRLLNFGDRFNTDKHEDDFLRWVKLALKDIAQTGDGAILTQYVPPDEALNLPGRVRYVFYPYEAWDRQNEPIFGDLEYYRVEFLYVGNDSKHYFYRRDYHPGFKKIYHDKEADDNWERGIMPPKHSAVALDSIAGVVPPKIEFKEESTEDGALSDLGECCFVEVLWNEKDMDSYRGYPEIWYDDLPSIDAANEILNALPEAVIYAGNQPLAMIDCHAGIGPDKKPIEIKRADMAAGARMELVSTHDIHPGKLTFPEHPPTQLLHDDGLKHMRAAAMAGTPNMRLDQKGMMEISRLSGFAYQILTSQFMERVEEIRKGAVARILKGLRLGIKLLKLKDELPAGLPDDFDIVLDYGETKMTEDELVKQATRLLVYDKLGIPRDVIIRLIPGISTDDIEKVIAGVLEKQQLDEKVLIGGMQQAAGAAIKTPEAGDNVDNKAR